VLLPLIADLKTKLSLCLAKASAKSIGFAMRKELVPLMEQIRSIVDALELKIPEKYYPIPSYTELLFKRD